MGSKSSNVYICHLDASKAFDRINHWYLCDKLIKRGMPKLFIRLLLYWFQTQLFAVRWNNVLSLPFNVSNGVRQGGILSPHLFNAYIDELSENLNMSRIGCHLQGVCYNHLMYADDAVIMAPSPKGLQKLIDICDNFAGNNDMLFNAKKTVCMCIKRSSSVKLRIPDLYLGNNKLSWLTRHKYLGVYISDDVITMISFVRENVFTQRVML